jgi:hypothetical protein
MFSLLLYQGAVLVAFLDMLSKQEEEMVVRYWMLKGLVLSLMMNDKKLSLTNGVAFMRIF